MRCVEWVENGGAFRNSSDLLTLTPSQMRACESLGAALGVCTHVRATRPLIDARHAPVVIMPVDVLLAVGATADDIVRRVNGAAVCAAVRRLVDRAEELVRAHRYNTLYGRRAGGRVPTHAHRTRHAHTSMSTWCQCGGPVRAANASRTLRRVRQCTPTTNGNARCPHVCSSFGWQSILTIQLYCLCEGMKCFLFWKKIVM